MSVIVALLVGVLGAALLALFGNESPANVFSILISGSFGSLDAIGYTLYYATPFIFTGLAVAIPYRAGLFNIGGEGQLYMGAIFTVAAHQFFGDCGGFTPWIYIGFAFLGGALWAGIAGVLKAWRGCHEVITTIMLNFVALSLANYFVISVWKDPKTFRAETSLFPEVSWLKNLGLGESPLNFAFILALFAAFFTWFLLSRTNFGFRLRAVGLNPSAAESAGYSPQAAIISSICLGGALATGAAINDLLGQSHRMIDGFSSGYGFVGIAVAFLGRNHPIGIVLAAIFFGALFKGSGDLDIETESITRDFCVVLQALFILAVASEKGLKEIFNKVKGVFIRGS